MSLRVSIAIRAETDMAHQYRWYLDNADQKVADRFFIAIDESIIRLAGHPELGRRRRFRSPELPGIRSFPAGGRFGVHLLFYRFDESVLSIERVIHGARDLPRRLLEMPG